MLVLSPNMILISITTAAQQHNTLQKIACQEDWATRIQQLLSRRNSKSTTPSTDPIQHFIWQTPIMLLNFGILLYVAGLLGLVFSQPFMGDSTRQNNIGVEVVFALATVFTVGSYLNAWLGVSSKLQNGKTKAQAPANQV